MKKALILFFVLVINGVVFAKEKFLTINPQGHKSTIHALLVDSKGKIITAGYDKTIKIWNSKEGYLEREILGQIGPGSEGIIYALALSPDEKYLAVSGWFGSDNGTEVVGDIRIYNYATGKLIKLLKGHADAAFDMAFFQNSTNFISVGRRGDVLLWDVKSDDSWSISTVPADITAMEIFSYNFVTTHASGMVYLWDVNKTEKPIASYKKLQKEGLPAMCLAVSPNGERIAVSSYNYVYILTNKLKDIYSFYHGEDEISKLCFSPNSQRLLITSSSIYLKENLTCVYEERDEKWYTLSAYKKHTDAISNGAFINNGICVTAGGANNEVAIWKVEESKKNSTLLHFLVGVGKPLHSVGMRDDKIAFATTWTKNDGFSAFQTIFDLTNREMNPYSITDSCSFPLQQFDNYSASVNESLNTLTIKKDGKTVKAIKRDNFNGSLHFVYTYIPQRYIVSGGGYGIIEVYDLAGNKMSNLVGHEGDLRGLAVSTDQKFLISGSQDQTIRIWKIDDFDKSKNVYPEVSIFAATNGEWVMWNEEGYFTSSKKGAAYVGFHINQGRDKEAKYYTFEQFDVKYNRPDIIMDSLGIVDNSIIELYHGAYLKRLKRMNLSEADLSGDMNAPAVRMSSTNISKQKISLTISVSDSLYSLKTLNVFLNDVPVYGRNGLVFEKQNLKKIEQTVELDLMAGLNKIQVSATNVAGVESLKETVNITNSTETESNLYVVSLGVSDYKDSLYNLDYASKDAEDVNALFADASYFNNVYSKLIINENVTRENIVALKPFLGQANRNDVVLFFIAGHGVLNKNLDYYFCTHDMDFLAPEKNGITYAELEILFDGIKAIRKLLIMDTCHSGEVDKDDVEEVAFVNTENEDIAFRNTNTTTTIRETQGLQKTNEAVKEMFNDLRAGTGATVISSAGGAEYAMESDEWKNGLFTYCLLEGIKTKNADLDNNGEILLSELQNYISSKVAELSNGRQMPTSRFENLNLDYRIW